jgi:hypothetical protein
MRKHVLVAASLSLWCSSSVVGAQETRNPGEYVGPNRIFALVPPPAPNPFATTYRRTALATGSDRQFDRVLLHADDFGQFIVVGARVLPQAAVDDMDRDGPPAVFARVSQATLLSWRPELRDRLDSFRDTIVETAHGEATVRIYRVTGGSRLARASGRRPTAAGRFDTNIASVVIRRGAVMIFVIAQDDSDPDDPTAVMSMAEEVLKGLRILASP